jgi:hypothetical protein
MSVRIHLGQVALSASVALSVVACASSVPRDDLPIEDDFSGDCKWSEDESEAISLGCENGEYRLLFKNTQREDHHYIPRRSETAVDSVSMETDATLRTFGGGRDDFEFHGIGCWASKPDKPARGFVFVLEPAVHGFAIVENDETNQSLKKSDYFRALVDKASAAVPAVGAKAHLRADCRATATGVELKMFVNGTQLGTATDSNRFGPFEAFGFLALSTKTGTDIRYDNFSAKELG